MKRQFSMIPSCVVVVLAVLILLWAPALALAKPPPKEGNPGVPGLLYEIEQLEAENEQLKAKIKELETMALVPKTGQTSCFNISGDHIDCNETGQDGDIQAGIQWPHDKRFKDNGDGTVTDNLTGLIWLKHASCEELPAERGHFNQNDGTWSEALYAANNLKDLRDGGDCNLTDGSKVGDWRLPNINELRSLLEYPAEGPSFPSYDLEPHHPFDGTDYYPYWSSTTPAHATGSAWCVNTDFGEAYNGDKERDRSHYVWPVRDPQ